MTSEVRYIKAHCEFVSDNCVGTDRAAQQKLETNFIKLLQQIRRDAVAGSYGEYSPAIFKNKSAKNAFEEWDANAVKIEQKHGDADLRNGVLPFEIRLAPDLFSDPRYGLQKIVHFFASDLFERSVPEVSGKFAVRSLDLGDAEPAFTSAYRCFRQSHSIADIQDSFEIGRTPLLAFSLKPRTGLGRDDYLRITEDALNNGVDIVEMDTRDLPCNLGDWKGLVKELYELALEISEKRNEVRRFSANLSLPYAALGDFPKELAEIHSGKPWVVKIDGNLDGMSLIQSIRSDEAISDIRQPIITCYPLLKYPLARYLGNDTFVHFLALSGADIIYPGRRPRISTGRDIDSQHINDARRHYEKVKEKGWPLPSIAGGVHAGQLHAMHALLGPDVAYFLGGGIGLAKDGVAAGAKLCSDTLKEAARLCAEGNFEEHQLEEKFARVKEYYHITEEHTEDEFQYFSPNILRKKGVTLWFS